MNKQTVNIQDTFLNQLRKDNIPVTVYLVNGFQIRGVIRAFDNFTIVVESEGKQMMVYKHAISTFTPGRPVSLHPPTQAPSEERA
ncbi:MAG: RNA chaperone Hfq [Kyrpidia sp.]|nr:RNA chaperone Hfq [Kyrpidia sp.]